MSRFALAAAVKVDLLVSKRTAFSFKTNLIPSPTRSTSAPGSALSISLACLSILCPITPPATPPTTPPRTAPIAPFPPLPRLFPRIPPITAPPTAPIPAPRCALFVFFIDSQLVDIEPIVKTKTNTDIVIFFIIYF